ncbi:MAG: phosphatase PAP2 family protein [Rhizobiales bacterium]|nr:phosphatase PAP2 family protein [Hyphomicrobiales bacterium]
MTPTDTTSNAPLDAATKVVETTPEHEPAATHTPYEMAKQAAVPVFAFAFASMTHGLDRWLAYFMKNNVNDHMAYFWRFMTDRGQGTLYIVIAVIGLFGGILAKRLSALDATREKIATIQRYCFLLLVSLAASGAVLHFVKFFGGRHRPRDLFANGAYGFEPFSMTTALDSFPSGHSQTIFCVTTVLALAFPKHWKAISLFGLLVALSRVTMTNHFISDVAVGSWLAIFTVLALAPWALRERETGMLSAHSGRHEGAWAPKRKWGTRLRLGRLQLTLGLRYFSGEKKD